MKKINLRCHISILVLIMVLVLIIPMNISFAVNEAQEAPLNPEFIKYLEEINDLKFKANKMEPYGRGLIPEPIRIERNLNFLPRELENISFPSRFDLREKNKLTPVRDQRQNGSCWTFAAYASLESWLMPTEVLDFSENNMKNTHGFNWAHNAGGNRTMSTAYLTRWGGPVLEDDDPYNDQSGISPQGLDNVKQIKDVLFLPNRANSIDNNYIKWALMEYGAVQSSYYDNDIYFNIDNNSYYYNGGNQTNHAIAIVGWDDNYSKANFKITPPGDGAFIVKNSWGKNWGEDGYFYISYYDTKIGNENAVYVNAMDIGYYDNIYQYDPFGSTSAIGFGGNINWFANIFTSKEYEEDLVATAFYTRSEDVKYEVWIDTDFKDEDFSKLRMVKEGTIDIPGYHTIDFNPEKIAAGKSFAIVIKITTTDPKDYFPISLEKSISGYVSNATANIGESYISPNGKTWYELTTYEYDGKIPYSNTNVNLKAFTKNPFVPVEDITLDNTNLILTLNQQKTLLATILPEDATNKKIIWRTEDSSIAMVDENGVVKATGIGVTNIVATTEDGNHSVRCTVEVLKYPVEVSNLAFDNLTVSINLSKISNDVQGIIIVQAYDENNRPLKLMYSNEGILMDSYEFDFSNTLKPISYIKVFVWDGLDNMKPLTYVNKYFR